MEIRLSDGSAAIANSTISFLRSGANIRQTYAFNTIITTTAAVSIVFQWRVTTGTVTLNALAGRSIYAIRIA